MNEPSPIVVSGPALPETLRVLRGVAAGVGARFDLAFDRIEELRIAVDEAATLVLRAGAANTITLEVDAAEPAALRLRVRSDGVVGGWPGDREGSWAWRVISELASGATMSLVEGCPEVSFSWIMDQSIDGQGSGVD